MSLFCGLIKVKTTKKLNTDWTNYVNVSYCFKYNSNTSDILSKKRI